jgi:hypothetical protein
MVEGISIAIQSKPHSQTGLVGPASWADMAVRTSSSAEVSYQPILAQGIQLEPTATITLVPAGRNVTV